MPIYLEDKDPYELWTGIRLGKDDTLKGTGHREQQNQEGKDFGGYRGFSLDVKTYLGIP